MAVADHLDEEFTSEEEMARIEKLCLAQTLGHPFADSTVADWRETGRRYSTSAAEMQRLNASFDRALADQDLELIARLLEQAEAIFNGGLYDVEAVFADHMEPAAELADRARWAGQRLRRDHPSALAPT